MLPVQYPAEIENYRSIGSTPVLLAAGLAVGTVVARGLTLTASVRRRRRDLVLLKSIGFTQRQLMSCVGVQSTVAVLIGILVGTPLGILLGKRLWILFAHDILGRTPTNRSDARSRLRRRCRPCSRERDRGDPWKVCGPHPTVLILRAE